ncbi:unnamed protein product, partial [marine sediment metagenome]
MSTTVKVHIPMAITAIVSVLVMSVYFFSLPPFMDALVDELLIFTNVVLAITVGLGTAFLIRAHSSRIIKRQKGEWYYSIILLLSITVFPLAHFIFGIGSPTFQTLYTNVIGNIGACIYGIVFFAETGASYRAFRAKNWGGLCLLISAMFIYLKNAPIGDAVWIGFRLVGEWITNYPLKGAMRGLMIT